MGFVFFEKARKIEMSKQYPDALWQRDS